jgi:hypothetical protein
VKIRTNFTFRIDTWTADGESVVEHVASVEDYQGCTCHLSRRLRTGRHPHHLAAGCASDRRQPAPARGVGEFSFCQELAEALASTSSTSYRES